MVSVLDILWSLSSSSSSSPRSLLRSLSESLMRGNAGRLGLFTEEGEDCDASRPLRSSTTHLKEINNNLVMTHNSCVNNPTDLISGSANIRGSASSILSREDKDPSSISLEWSEMFEIFNCFVVCTSLLFHLSLFTGYGSL